MLTVVFALLAAASDAVAYVLQRKANLDEVADGRTGLAGLAHLLRTPVWLGGIGAVILAFVFQAAALDTGGIAEVQPLLSLELPLTLLLASRVFRRRIPTATWVDVAAMTAGISLFVACLQPSGGDPGRTAGVAWAFGAGVPGLVILALVVASYLSTGSRRAALLGVVAGTAYGLTALFIAGALAPGLSWAVFARWQTYLVAVAGLTAVVALQEAFRAGSLVAVQPGVTLADPLVSVLLGVLLFGESAQTGWWVVPEVLGAALTTFGVVRLSRSPAVAAAQGVPDPA